MPESTRSPEDGAPEEEPAVFHYADLDSHNDSIVAFLIDSKVTPKRVRLPLKNPEGLYISALRDVFYNNISSLTSFVFHLYAFLMYIAPRAASQHTVKLTLTPDMLCKIEIQEVGLPPVPLEDHRELALALSRYAITNVYLLASRPQLAGFFVQLFAAVVLMSVPIVYSEIDYNEYVASLPKKKAAVPRAFLPFSLADYHATKPLTCSIRELVQMHRGGEYANEELAAVLASLLMHMAVESTLTTAERRVFAAVIRGRNMRLHESDLKPSIVRAVRVLLSCLTKYFDVSYNRILLHYSIKTPRGARDPVDTCQGFVSLYYMELEREPGLSIPFDTYHLAYLSRLRSQWGFDRPFSPLTNPAQCAETESYPPFAEAVLRIPVE